LITTDTFAAQHGSDSIDYHNQKLCCMI